MRYYVSEKKSGKETLVAICDEDVMGKKFSSPPLCLEVREDFYKGELVEESELATFLSRATILNLSGKNIVRVAQEMGLVRKERILEIGGTLHAQMARL